MTHHELSLNTSKIREMQEKTALFQILDWEQTDHILMYDRSGVAALLTNEDLFNAIKDNVASIADTEPQDIIIHGTSLQKRIEEHPDLRPLVLDAIATMKLSPSFSSWALKNLHLDTTRKSVWERSLRYYFTHKNHRPLTIPELEQAYYDDLENKYMEKNYPPYALLIKGIRVGMIEEYIQSWFPKTTQPLLQ